LLGFLQDKYGHKASILLIISEVVIFFSLTIAINEEQLFNWTAYLIMFGLGCLDNSLKSYQNVIVGFEFESKLVPFGANFFFECFSSFLSIFVYSFNQCETKGEFRTYFIMKLVLGCLCAGSLFLVKFKQVKRDSK